MHQTLLRRTVIAHREQATPEGVRVHPLLHAPILDALPDFEPLHELFVVADPRLPRGVRRHERDAVRALAIEPLRQMVGALEDTIVGDDDDDGSGYETAPRVRRMLKMLVR